MTTWFEASLKYVIDRRIAGDMADPAVDRYLRRNLASPPTRRALEAPPLDEAMAIAAAAHPEALNARQRALDALRCAGVLPPTEDSPPVQPPSTHVHGDKT